jgi:hypothetical protein
VHELLLAAQASCAKCACLYVFFARSDEVVFWAPHPKASHSSLVRVTDDHVRVADDHVWVADDHVRVTDDHVRVTDDHVRVTDDHVRASCSLVHYVHSSPTTPVRASDTHVPHHTCAAIAHAAVLSPTHAADFCLKQELAMDVRMMNEQDAGSMHVRAARPKMHVRMHCRGCGHSFVAVHGDLM